MDDCKQQSDVQPKREDSGAFREMPKYQSHKQVWALKIVSIESDIDLAQKEGRETTGGAWITPQAGFGVFQVDREYVRKHNPQAGGYYVVYEDGYASWSPSAPFEAGYSLLA